MIKRIIRGAKKSPPGTGVVFILSVLIGLPIIGLDRNLTWQGAVLGGTVMFIMAGMPWLIVAYQNGDN